MSPETLRLVADELMESPPAGEALLKSVPVATDPRHDEP
jgi:hypothetical protein